MLLHIGIYNDAPGIAFILKDLSLKEKASNNE